MSVAAPLIDNMYRHENGLKHINIVKIGRASCRERV